jgi:hypothetical protein
MRNLAEEIFLQTRSKNERDSAFPVHARSGHRLRVPVNKRCTALGPVDRPQPHRALGLLAL